jgi:predicted site-specific integrase-resolvase
VSSAKQKTSLETQEKIIKAQYPEAQIRKDIGSGFNFERKGFVSLLESCLSGNAITIVVTTQDRICRVGFPLIRWIVELYGGRVILLEENDRAVDQFDTATLVAFVTSFINSYHGKRSSRRKKAALQAEGP